MWFYPSSVSRWSLSSSFWTFSISEREGKRKLNESLLTEQQHHPGTAKRRKHIHDSKLWISQRNSGLVLSYGRR
ncbi:hypothetical protein EYF80_022823 [Liparis tanakae]|uniref:Uncharacterized protein n=1 Tax=Liparis tanakae TaxID=230148 RepID=A0A4Z2HM40_9TELE|nr:hypothetical protein EYF80_022823 [Liparis tanakae]